nr:hypothetical protein [Tanacetum cinerariifolium]
NKDKLCELARTPLNEHCSAVLLNKLPEKLGDPDIGFLLEEVDAFLTLEDDPTSLEVDQSYVDTEGDILLLEAFLNDDPSSPPPNQGNYMPQDLPLHLKYVFLEGDDNLPVIIAKYLSVEEKTTLITVLKSHKRAIAWKLSDIKENEENELIPTHWVTGWRVCIDYRKAISKFPSIQKIKKKPHSLVHMERLLTAACLLGYAMYWARFRGEESLYGQRGYSPQP